MAYEFVKPKVSTLKVKANVDVDEVLVQEGVLPSGKKRTVTIGGFKLGGTLDEANVVFDKVLGGIAGTTYDSITAMKFATERLAEIIYNYVDVQFTMADIEPIFAGTYQLSGNNQFTASDIDAIFNGTYQVSGRNKFTVSDIEPIFAGESPETEPVKEKIFTMADVEPIFDGSYQLSGNNTFTASDIDAIFNGTYEISGRNTFAADDINFFD